MKYKYSIEIRNETDKDEIFNKYKQIIYDHIMEEIDGSFNFDLDLLIVFRELDEDKMFINEETYNAGTTLIENRYAIILNIDSLENLPEDGGCDLAISVYHELCHVYDLHHVMHNSYYSVNPLTPNNYTALKDFTISKGWGFWTEFHAYYLTYKKFKDEYDCPTFLQIVKGYEELKKQLDGIKSIPDLNTEESQTILRSFKENIEEFIYFIAKYLAGSIFDEKGSEVFDENVMESDASVRIDEIYYKSIEKLLPLIHKAYGMRLSKKLYNLGKYLLTDIYEEFNMFTIEHEGRIVFAYSD